MDLIDLFIGSEGTLGIITEVTLRVVPDRPALCLAFVPFGTRRDGIAFVAQLREPRRWTTWRREIPTGWTCRPSSTWMPDAWRCCAKTAPIASSASSIPDARSRCSSRSSCPGHDRRRRVRSDWPRSRVSTRRLTRFCRALDDGRRARSRGDRRPGRRRARGPAARPAGGRPGRRQCACRTREGERRRAHHENRRRT